MSWIKCKDKLPPLETAVLIVWSGNIVVGELRRETPGFEDTFKAFDYWDDPTDDGQIWEWYEVTHWHALPSLPEPLSNEEMDKWLGENNIMGRS